MKKVFTLLLSAALALSSYAATPIQGQLSGKFTINANNDQVSFSQGNLQFNAAQGTHTTQDSAGVAGTWRFATNQYDICGSNNTQRHCYSRSGELIDVWLDLFYRATSGWQGYLPDIYKGAGVAGAPVTEMVGDYAWYDWGVYNAISNGGDQVGLWRTLTQAEWYYLLVTRDNAANLRGFAAVNDVNGYVLLPDNWSLPNGLTFTPDPADFTVNVYDVDQWSAMQAAGAVFLPCAGYASVYNSGNYVKVRYNSSTKVSVQYTQSRLYMDPDLSSPYYFFTTTTENSTLFSVRLVHDLLPDTYWVKISQPANGEITIDNDDKVLATQGDSVQVNENTVLQLTATPNEGFILDQWTNYDPATGLKVTSDTAVTCSFKVQTFEVKFFDDDDTQIGETQIINYGEDAEAPADPSREGYTFTGWDTDWTNVKSDLNIKATYEANKYTVTLTAVHCFVRMYIKKGSTRWAGSSTEQFTDIPYGSMVYFAHGVDNVGDPENYMGYEFDHWEGYTPEYDSNNNLLYSVKITSDLVVKCVYKEKTFQVTFVDWDGTELKAAQGVLFKHAAVPPTNPTREGYTFIGWNKDISSVRSDLTVTACYEQNNPQPTVLGDGALRGAFSVNSSGKRIVFSQGNLQYRGKTATWQFAEHQYESIMGENDLREDGAGWRDLFGWGKETGCYTEEEKAELYEPPTFIEWGNHTIRNSGFPNEQWYTMDTLEWRYLLEGRANAAELRGFATLQDMHGYVFLPDNWQTPEGLSFTAGDTWDVNVYDEEQWQPMEQAGAVFLPITFEDQYGAIGYYHTSQLDQAYQVGPMEFVFQYSKQNHQYTSMVYGPYYLTARYLVRLVKEYVGYEVTLTQPEHGTLALVETGVNLSDVPEYSTLHFSATPEEGYELASWSGYNPETGLFVTANATVTATFQKQTFSVQFVDWDDTPIGNPQIIEWGEAATAPADPDNREGWHFDHWDTDFSNVKGELTVKAVYAINMYTLTIEAWENGTVSVKDAENQEVDLSEQIPHGSVLTLTATPSEEKYEFVKWSDDNTDNPRTLTLTGDLTLAVTSQIRSLAVRFIDVDGSVIDEQSIEWGNDATAPADPEHEGLVFMGWSTTDLTNITANLDVQALYKITQVDVTVVYPKVGDEIVPKEAGSVSTALEAPYHVNTWLFLDAEGQTINETVFAENTTYKMRVLLDANNPDIAFFANYDEMSVRVNNESPEVTIFRAGNNFKGFIINFEPEPNATTGLGEMPSDEAQCTKVLRNGQLLIKHNGKTYNVLGAEVR